jgi:hypothetical protein
MDKVQKLNNADCNIPSSECFRNDLQVSQLGSIIPRRIFGTLNRQVMRNGNDVKRDL